MHRRILLSWGLTALLAHGLLGGVISLAAGGKSRAAMATNAWRVAEAVSYENLSVFPVMAREGAETSGFITLDEALASGQAVVTERGGEILRRTREGGQGRPVPLPAGGAQVNALVLINRGSKPVVLLAGEVLSGGKQDRVIAKDRIVAPQSEPLPLDVFCVERGRWAGASAQFSAAKMMVHPSVREKAAIDQDQSQVWAAVRSGTTAGGVLGGISGGPPGRAEARLSRRALEGVVASEAPSESYIKVYRSSRVGGSVETFAEEIARRFARATANLKGERVVGVVVAYGGELAWADVFGSPELFERYWGKLLRSYAVEALARPQSTERASLEDARQFVQPLAGRENVENEPGVYRWRQVTQGRYAEIELQAMAPTILSLHWVKIHRTG